MSDNYRVITIVKIPVQAKCLFLTEENIKCKNAGEKWRKIFSNENKFQEMRSFQNSAQPIIQNEFSRGKYTFFFQCKTNF